MGGTAVCVNIGSVRLVVDHIGLRLKCLEYALCNGRRASVCTVKTNLYVLEVTACKWRSGIRYSGYVRKQSRWCVRCLLLRCKWKSPSISPSIYVFDHLLLSLCFNLVSLPVHDLDSVVIERVMAGGDHNSAVKILGAYYIGNTRCCCYMKQIMHLHRKRSDLQPDAYSNM